VPKQGPSNIAVLVAQLGAEHFSDREAAAAAIEKLGPAAFDALRAGTRSDSPEIRERATTLLTKLERRVSSASRLTAKRVKLDYQDIPLGAALNDLKARTGLNFVLDPERVANPLRKITCQTTDLPAWEAVEAFCQAAGLQEEFRQELDVPKPSTSRRGYMPPPSPPNADAVPITLIDGKHERLPGSRSSAVRVLVLPHTFPGHRVTLGTGETTLAFDVAPAPGLGWVEVTGVKITRVIDSNDRAGSAGVDKNTSPDEEFNGMMFGRGPGIAMRFDINGNSIMPSSLANPRIVSVPLKLATATATSLKRLEGVVFGDIQLANQHLITVENPKQHLATSFDGPQELKFGVLELKDPPGPGGLGTIKVQLEFPSDFGLNVRRRGFNGFGWPQPPRMGQGYRVEAFDATGKPFPLSSNGFSGISNDGMTMRQEFTMTFRPGQGSPAKLVVIGPKTVTVEVPFALENDPLP
jgi:hypothetical protein